VNDGQPVICVKELGIVSGWLFADEILHAAGLAIALARLGELGGMESLQGLILLD
jgi:hypothetical protein